MNSAKKFEQAFHAKDSAELVRIMMHEFQVRDTNVSDEYEVIIFDDRSMVGWKPSGDIWVINTGGNPNA